MIVYKSVKSEDCILGNNGTRNKMHSIKLTSTVAPKDFILFTILSETKAGTITWHGIFICVATYAKDIPALPPENEMNFLHPSSALCLGQVS